VFASLPIAFLPNNAGTVRGVSSQTLVGEQLMQITQRRYGDHGFTSLHGRTHSQIEHPLRNYPYYTRLSLDVDYTTAPALLDVPNLDAVTIQRMPTIMDFNFLPDMGRMNGKWQQREIRGCSATQWQVRRRVPWSTVSF
jgi:hypothetical protein